MASTGLSVEEALNKPVQDLDLSKASPTSNQNGTTNGPSSSTSDSDEVQEIKLELEKTRQERDSFENQYKGLLAKLTQMRTTLGDRLRQDAEELDRREEQIQSLTTRNEELESTTSTLQSELITSHEETTRLTSELDSLRASHASLVEEHSNLSSTATNEAKERDRTESSNHQDWIKSRELQESNERLRLELESLNMNLSDEKSLREDLEGRLKLEEEEKTELERKFIEMRELARSEGESARGLQSVLEEFQEAQDTELQRALGDYQHKYDRVAASLEEHKERSANAEAQLSQYREDAKRCKDLEKDVKEKGILIGKLRHEAIFLNEHLTEALRRLQRDTSETNVDRRLVTNLLLQFLTTPRADAKRFEMLSLIASVLSWNDEERETAGLQKTGNPAGGKNPGGGSRKVGIGAQRDVSKNGTGGHGRAKALDGGAGDESFSNLFVEFLLSEADKAKASTTSSSATPTSPGSPSASNAPAPFSPTSPGTPRSSFRLDTLANLRRPSSSSVPSEGATSPAVEESSK